MGEIGLVKISWGILRFVFSIEFFTFILIQAHLNILLRTSVHTQESGRTITMPPCPRQSAKIFTIGEVQDWVEKHGGIDGRLRWFEAYSPNNAFYQRIAKPLLSIRTAGSIDVERKVKPLKSKILTKSRNQSRDQKSQMLFRASENLRQLSKIKMEFKRQGIPLPSTLARSNDFATCTPVKTNIKAQGIKSSDSDTEEE